MAARRSELTALERGVALGLALARGEVISTRLIRDRFGVSPAQAKRDLLALETTARADSVVREGDGRVTLTLAAAAKK